MKERERHGHSPWIKREQQRRNRLSEKPAYKAKRMAETFRNHGQISRSKSNEMVNMMLVLLRRQLNVVERWYANSRKRFWLRTESSELSLPSTRAKEQAQP